MKARSESSSNNQAFHGRLNAMDGDGWCSSLPNSNGEWLQVDIGIMIQACGLATQGNKEWFFKRRWVTAFKLSYSLDGTNWETYRNVTGGEMVRFKEGAFPIFNLKGERTDQITCLFFVSLAASQLAQALPRKQNCHPRALVITTSHIKSPI